MNGRFLAQKGSQSKFKRNDACTHFEQSAKPASNGSELQALDKVNSAEAGVKRALDSHRWSNAAVKSLFNSKPLANNEWPTRAVD